MLLSRDRNAADREETLELLYEAVADCSQWRPLLQRLLRRFDSDRIVLFTGAVFDPAARLEEAIGHPPGYLETYFTHHLRNDPLTTIAYRRGMIATGVTVLDRELVPADEWRRSQFINDCLLPAGIAHRAGVTILDGTDGTAPRLTLTVHRDALARPFGDAIHRELHWVGRHFARAGRLRAKLQSSQAKNDTLAAVLDAMQRAAVVTDATGRVVYANLQAETLLREIPGLYVLDRLSAPEPPEQHRLRGMLAAACGAGSGERLAGSTIRLRLPTDKPVLLVSVTPLPSTQTSQVRSERLALVQFSAPAITAPDLAQRLRDLFRLSPAEVRVVAGLLAGQTRAEIAAHHKVSPETVATHVKRALAKTGTERQQEMLALVSML